MTHIVDGEERIKDIYMTDVADMLTAHGYAISTYYSEGEMGISRDSHRLWLTFVIGKNSEIELRHKHENTGFDVARLVDMYFKTVEPNTRPSNSSLSTVTFAGGNRRRHRRSRSNRRRQSRRSPRN
jgi:hypothetical protein